MLLLFVETKTQGLLLVLFNILLKYQNRPMDDPLGENPKFLPILQNLEEKQNHLDILSIDQTVCHLNQIGSKGLCEDKGLIDC